MTKDALILAFNHTKSDYLLAAEASMKSNPLPSYRPRLRYALIAATLVLLVALTPIIILLANRATPPPNPPQPSTHLSITDIPGAKKINTDKLIKIETSHSEPIGHDAYVARLRKKSCAVGTAKLVSAVAIPNGDSYYSIMTFDITVKDASNNPLYH